MYAIWLNLIGCPWLAVWRQLYAGSFEI